MDTNARVRTRLDKFVERKYAAPILWLSLTLSFALYGIFGAVGPEVFSTADGNSHGKPLAIYHTNSTKDSSATWKGRLTHMDPLHQIIFLEAQVGKLEGYDGSYFFSHECAYHPKPHPEAHPWRSTPTLTPSLTRSHAHRHLPAGGELLETEFPPIQYPPRPDSV